MVKRFRLGNAHTDIENDVTAEGGEEIHREAFYIHRGQSSKYCHRCPPAPPVF
jgi:hypothetical protein